MNLSERQNEFLAYIRCYEAKYGQGPTYREIALAMNVTSKGTVSAMVNMLLSKGAVAKSGTARGLTVRERSKSKSK